MCVPLVAQSMRTGHVLKHTILGRDLDEVTSALDHGFGIDWKRLQHICARSHVLTDPAKFSRLLSVWPSALQVRHSALWCTLFICIGAHSQHVMLLTCRNSWLCTMVTH